MSIIWTIIIGFVAGIIAKFLHPGPNEPSGFILTTILGIVGALVATYLGTLIGWYQAGEGAGLIGAIVGAVIVLVDPGAGRRAGSRRGVVHRPSFRKLRAAADDRNARPGGWTMPPDAWLSGGRETR